MFWIYSVLAMIGFALNYLFITKIVRGIPSFQSIAYRGFGLMVSMSPFLLLVPQEQFLQISPYLPSILLGSFFSTVSLWALFYALRSIPLGIATSVRQGFGIVSLALLGVFFLGNNISFLHWVFILCIIFINGYLGFLKSDMNHLKEMHVFKSALLCFISGIGFALGLFFMGKVSIAFSPYLSGYIWEMGIGCMGLLMSLCTKEYQQKSFQWKTYLNMLWASSPTALATFGVALAATLGPLGVIGAIQSGSIIIISLLSVALHKEHLKLNQWIALISIMLLIIGFRLF